MHAAVDIERFPAWAVRAQFRQWRRRIQIGLEHDIRKMTDLWQRYPYRQVTTQCDLLAMPDDNGVVWQLDRRVVANGLRQDLVLVRDGYVSIEKHHLGNLREGLALLAEYLENDHPPHLHVCDEAAREYVRKIDAPPPVVSRGS